MHLAAFRDCSHRFRACVYVLLSEGSGTSGTAIGKAAKFKGILTILANGSAFVQLGEACRVGQTLFEQPAPGAHKRATEWRLIERASYTSRFKEAHLKSA